MKRPIFMLILAIHGLLLGSSLILSPSESAKTFGFSPIDFYHGDLSIHIGLLVLVISLFTFLKRNSENQELVNTLLWIVFLAGTTGVAYDIISLKHGVASPPTSAYIYLLVESAITIATGFYLKKFNS